MTFSLNLPQHTVPVHYRGINRAHHPPLPINQGQAIKMMQDLNNTPWYTLGTSMPVTGGNILKQRRGLLVHKLKRLSIFIVTC